MSAYPNRLNGYYTIEGVKYPSVSTILQAVAKPALYHWYFKRGHELTKEAPSKDMKGLWSDFNVKGRGRMDLGVDVHNYMEAFFKKQSYMPPLLGSPYLKAVKLFLAQESNNFEPISVERQLHSVTHGMAGTCDLIAKYKGKVFVIDWKTNDSARLFDDVALQMSPYAKMAEEMGIVERVDGRMAVSFGLEGKFTVGEYDDCFDTFLATMKLWKFLNNHA